MQLPDAVQKTFAQLRLEYPFYIVLSKINGGFYVYRSHTWWDKELKKVRAKTVYLGRIEEDGKFVKKIEQPQPSPVYPIADYKLDKVDETLLTYLSMNCRYPISKIAKTLGLSTNVLVRRKQNLERRFGIRYLASINYLKLGYSTYLIFVNFKDRKPVMEDLKEALKDEPHIQLALSAQGSYDLVLYLLVENSAVLNSVVFQLRNNERLKDYESIWTAVVFDQAYGYVPLRDRFFDLLEKNVWHRSKTGPRPASDSLMQREFLVLRELNTDGGKPFSDIEKKYNLGHGTCRYVFDKLKEKELLWRSTLTMEGYNVKYQAMILATVINEGSFLRDRQRFLHFIIKDYNAPSNRFALEGDTLSPEGKLFIMPVLKEGELETEIEWLRSQVSGIKLESAIVTNVLVGELCYRKMDNANSEQMNTLIKEYKEERPKNSIDYSAD